MLCGLSNFVLFPAQISQTENKIILLTPLADYFACFKKIQKNKKQNNNNNKKLNFDLFFSKNKTIIFICLENPSWFQIFLISGLESRQKSKQEKL